MAQEADVPVFRSRISVPIFFATEPGGPVVVDPDAPVVPISFVYASDQVFRTGMPASIPAPQVSGGKGRRSFDLHHESILPGSMTVSETDGSIAGVPDADCTPCTAWVEVLDGSGSNMAAAIFVVLPRPLVETTAPAPVVIGSTLTLPVTYRNLSDRGEGVRTYSLSGEPPGHVDQPGRWLHLVDAGDARSFNDGDHHGD